MASDASPFPHLAALHWHEGQFLRPQHLQRHAREERGALRYWGSLGRPGSHGVRRLAVEEAAIAKERIEVRLLDAVLPDGTIVQYPGNVSALEPLAFKEALDASREGSVTVHLCVPRFDEKRANTGATVRPGSLSAPPRWIVKPEVVADENTGERPVELDVRHVRATLEPRDRTVDGYESLPILRVLRAGISGALPYLDPDFCPPLMAAFAGSQPRRESEKLLTILEDKAKGLLGFFASAGGARATSSAADMEDVFRLHAYLTARSRIGAILGCPDPDPFALYLELQSLLGALSAATGEPSILEGPSFDHADPSPSFTFTFQTIARCLEGTRSVDTPLEPFADRGDNTWSIPLKPEWLTNSATRYFLAVESSLGKDRLAEIPRLLKLGVVRRVREYADRAVERLPIQWAPTVPPGARKGLAYFQVQTDQEEWARVANEGLLGLYTKGELGAGVRFYLCVVQRGV